MVIVQLKADEAGRYLPNYWSPPTNIISTVSATTHLIDFGQVPWRLPYTVPGVDLAHPPEQDRSYTPEQAY